MKKLLLFSICVMSIVLFSQCRANKKSSSGSSEDVVMEFAQEFGKMAKSGDISGIKAVYGGKETVRSASLDYDPENIEIFPEDDDKYKIKYGNGAYIIVRLGLNDALEVIDSEGIINTEELRSAADETAVKSTPEKDMGKASDDAAKKFASNFKKNVKADSNWKDAGWHDSQNYGDVYIYVNNKNSVPVDGSDYYITYKYEYLYEGGASMHSENCKQNGKTISAGGKQKFTHHYTDDCGPLKVKVNFKLTDKQIYDKYANR